MNIVFRHAWMQKHPTPTRTSGDFHWHPADVPEVIRATLTDVLTRSRGHAVSVWIIDDGYVAWARGFSAISPADQRRYTGLAATIAQPESGASPAAWGAVLPEVLARMPLPPAAPFAGNALADGTRIDSAPGGDAPLAVDPDSLLRLFDAHDTDLAATVMGGGQVFCLDPHADRLPALMGRLISWLPAGERTGSRTGALVGSHAGVGEGGKRRADNLLHYVTAAWFCPHEIQQREPGYPLRAWALVLDLAFAHGMSLPPLFAELTGVATAWDTADRLHRHLVDSGVVSAAELAACDRRAPAPLLSPAVPDAGWLWNRLLHYWGRGFLPASVMPSLAGLLARRVTVDHLFYLDAPEQQGLPGRYLRRLAYEALLAREQVAAIIDAVERYLPSLSPTREVQRG